MWFCHKKKMLLISDPKEKLSFPDKNIAFSSFLSLLFPENLEP